MGGWPRLRWRCWPSAPTPRWPWTPSWPRASPAPPWAGRPALLHCSISGEALARLGRFAEAEQALCIAVATDARLAELRGGGGAPYTRRPERVPCSHCGASSATPLHVDNCSRHQRCFGLIDPVKVWVQCDQCGLVRVDRPPSGPQLGAYYAALRGEGGDVAPPDAPKLFNHLVIADGILDRIDAHAPRSRRMLELGSAWGAFAAQAAWRGFDVVGVEAAPAAVAWSRGTLGLQVLEGSAPEVLPDGPFGVVALWEVIEHFIRPGDLLTALAERMPPGALLALSTPFLDHPMHRARGFDDPMWRVPGHLVYFDRATLKACLLAAGFEELERWSSPRHLGSGNVLARRV